MAPIADERLDALAEVVSARKITPATIRVQDVPGAGRGAAREPAPGRRAARRARGLRRGRRSGRRPRDVQARAARRRPRPRRAAARARREAGEVGRREAPRRGRASCRRCSRTSTRAARSSTTRASCRRELEPLTTKPLIAVENGPGRHRPEARGRARRAARRGGGGVPRRRRRRRSTRSRGRLRDALDLITFFTAGEKETRAWTLRNGETALDAADAIHSDIARGFIRCEVVDWHDLVEAGSHAEAREAGQAAPRGEDVRRPRRRRPEHPLQRLSRQPAVHGARHRVSPRESATRGRCQAPQKCVTFRCHRSVAQVRCASMMADVVDAHRCQAPTLRHRLSAIRR